MIRRLLLVGKDQAGEELNIRIIVSKIVLFLSIKIKINWKIKKLLVCSCKFKTDRMKGEKVGKKE